MIAAGGGVEIEFERRGGDRAHDSTSQTGTGSAEAVSAATPEQAATLRVVRLLGEMPAGFGHLSKHQRKAIQKRLDAGDFAVEIRLGSTTQPGAPAHHAATTLPALEAEIGKKINVRNIGEGDRR